MCARLKVSLFISLARWRVDLAFSFAVDQTGHSIGHIWPYIQLKTLNRPMDTLLKKVRLIRYMNLHHKTGLSTNTVLYSCHSRIAKYHDFYFFLGNMISIVVITWLNIIYLDIRRVEHET